MSEQTAIGPTPAVPAATHLVARATQALDLVVEIVTGSLLAATVIIALIQVFYRYVLNDSLPWPEEMARWAFIWLVFLGCALLTRRSGHIVIDILPRQLSPRGLFIHTVAVRIVVAASSAALLYYGADLVSRASYVSPALQWSFKYLYLAVPVGAALSLIFIAAEPIVGTTASPASGLLATLAGIGLFAALIAIGTIPFVGSFGVAWPLCILSIGLMLLGVPIVDSLIFGTIIAFLPLGDLALLTVPQNMTSALDSFLLLCIPFFIMAAGLMNVGGITEKLVALAASLVGHFRGGLGHVNVLTNTLMGGISGSSMADAAAIAKTMVPAMERRGYPKPFGVALTSAAAILANMIPPSLGLIIYGALATVSVGALFVATIVPGLLMAVTMSIVVHFECIRRGIGGSTERATGAQRWHALKVSLPALVLPLVIVGGIRYGIFTATEAGAVAAFYSLLVGLYVYRTTNIAGVIKAMRESLTETIAVVTIIAASAPFAWALVAEQVPQKLAVSMGGLTASPLLFMLVLNVFLLFVGLAMEMIASMVILVPILVPMLKAAHIDLVHFGVILVANMCIGALTPPLALLVFTAAKVTNTPIHEAYRACRPFMVGLLIWLAVISFVPWFSLAPLKWFAP